MSFPFFIKLQTWVWYKPWEGSMSKHTEGGTCMQWNMPVIAKNGWSTDYAQAWRGRWKLRWSQMAKGTECCSEEETTKASFWRWVNRTWKLLIDKEESIVEGECEVSNSSNCERAFPSPPLTIAPSQTKLHVGVLVRVLQRSRINMMYIYKRLIRHWHTGLWRLWGPKTCSQQARQPWHCSILSLKFWELREPAV